MKCLRIPSILLAVLVLLIGAGTTAFAAVLYFDSIPTTAVIDGGTGTWSTDTGNVYWKTSASGTTGTYWTDGNTAEFDPIIGTPTTSAVTVSGTVSTAGMNIYGSGYSFSGGTITTTSDIALGTNTATSATDATISSVLDGNTVTIKGWGTLTLNGANTLTGTTHIEPASGYYGPAAQGTRVKVGNALAFGTSDVIVHTYGTSGSNKRQAALDLNGFSIANQVTLNGPGNPYANPCGAVFNSVPGTTSELSGNVILASVLYICSRAATEGDINMSGLVSGGSTADGTYSFLKQGYGKLTLSGTANTFDGYVWLDDGVVEVANLDNVGVASSLGQPTNAARGIISFKNNSSTIIMPVLRYIGTTASSTDRVLQLVQDGTVEANGATVADTLTFTSDTSTATNTNGTLTLAGTNTGDNTFAGNITGGVSHTGGLIKDGPGKWILTALNTYVGPTTIKDGKLVVNGSITSAVSVEDGATLGGSGTIVGAVVAAGDSSIEPGQSLGTLTVTGNATIGGTLDVEYNGTDPEEAPIDVLAVSGDLNIDGATISFTDLGEGAPLDQPAYVFATYGGGLSGTPQEPVGTPTGYQVMYNYGDGHSIALVAIPEPASWILLFLAGLTLGAYARCRQ